MTGPVGNFAGIGSGFDYSSLVDQMIQLESAPAQAYQNRITAANAQLSAYKSYSTLLSNLESTAANLRNGNAFAGVNASVANASSIGGRSVLSASASSGAAPGSYAVQVLQTAQAEKLSGATFTSVSGALGLSGDFVINGKTITIAASDSLGAIRDKINVANTGTSPSGVSAAIVADSTNAQRLVLTSQKTGATGIDLRDGAQGVAQQLGWIDGSQTLKHATSAGAQSDTFASSTATIASQLGLAIAPGAQTVTIGGQSVSIDLGSDSLASIAAKLSSLNGIQASVQSSTVNGATMYYLDVRNTTSFVDAGNTLQQLGITVPGRSPVAQQLQSGALTAGDASTPATAATLLTALWNGGSASGAQAGDTLTIKGTRGDGSAVNITFTVAANSTVQDVLNALNDATSGFGAGVRPATASLDASGHIVLSDGTSGQSALSLQIVANNQGGGRLDFGAFAATTTGRARQLVAGADARFTVDGVAFTRASNTVSDVIGNTTLTLSAADPTVTATVTVDRAGNTAQTAVQSYVDAYNKLVDFIQQQQTPGANGAANPALYNDTLLRQARTSLSQAMLTTIGGAAADLSTAGMAGLALTKDGHLSLDASKFQTAFSTRFSDVQKLFMEQGTSTNASLFYTASTSATQGGTYAVNVTQPATQAQVTGSGFTGTYATSGTDTMTVTDIGSDASVRVALTNGMTTQQIVDALNASFTTAEARTLRSSAALTDASGAAPATTATLVTDLHLASGAAAGVVAGDSIDFAGIAPDGTPYRGTFVVGPGSSVANLVSAIQTSLGTRASVSFDDGQITVKSSTTGTSPLTFSITAKNEGGGSLDFGTVDTTASGHGVMALTASAVGSDIRITHGAYGATPGFTVAFADGGSGATAQLGIAAGSVHGTDVQGTIGGFAATGSGQQLVGAAGTPVDGLSIGYLGATTGSIGSVTLTQGVGSLVDRLLKAWTDIGGSVATRQNALNDTIALQQKRLDDFNARMDVRRQALLKVYLAMDTTVSKLKSQGSSILSAMGLSSSSSR
jgi:flagellar hook-associated protein 2